MTAILVTRGLAACLLAVALGACPALAADPPSLLGTWKMADDDHAAARLGGGNGYFDPMKEPTFGKPSDAWSYVFDKQDGRAFAGLAVGPNGKSEPIVGVFRQDGKSFLMSNATGSMIGEVIGDKLEICWSDHVKEWLAVSCTIYAKAP